MPKYRTTLFKDIKSRITDEYNNPRWEFGKRWMIRVGLPRLVSETAATEASGLLSSIHAGIHRNEPELENLLYDARKAAHEYNLALMRDNWRRYEGREK